MVKTFNLYLKKNKTNKCLFFFIAYKHKQPFAFYINTNKCSSVGVCLVKYEQMFVYTRIAPTQIYKIKNQFTIGTHFSLRNLL